MPVPPPSSAGSAAAAPTALPPASAAAPDTAAALDRGRAFLRAARHPSGAWPYTVGGPPRPEATVLALAAGDGPEWLAERWLTDNDLGWAGFLLPALAGTRAPALSAAWLDLIEAFRSKPVTADLAFDATIPGWSWVEGTAAWVQPTVFALLSLARAGRAPERVRQGVALLLDRQCDDGGWNYGNPEMLDARLAGYLDATGWALLALPPGPAADRGFAYLQGCLERPSTLALSLAALASAAHDRDPGPFLDALAPRVGEDGARGRVDLTALAVAALRLRHEGVHAFR